MTLSFELDPELSLKLKEIENLFIKIYFDLKSAPPEELEFLQKYSRISTIGSSTRIENAILTDIEINWIDTILTQELKEVAFEFHKEVIKEKFSPERERSIEEVAGCRAMLMSIFSFPEAFYPLRQNDLRALHHELMSSYDKAAPYAGKYKTVPNPVIELNKATNKTKTLFEPASAGPITDRAMLELLDWYNNNLQLNSWPIAIAAEFVYRFLAIHPFQDGNGRMGRGLFLLSLLNSNSESIAYVSRYLAIDRFIERHKDEYYFVLNKCSDGKFHEDSKKYKIQYFLRFILKILEEAIGNIEICRAKYKAEKSLPESAIKVLQCFKGHPELRLNIGMVLQEIELPRRTVEFALKTLVDNFILQKYGKGPTTKYQLTF